ncbi:MAG: hypothetical protein HY855_23380 [Burkholderiales bacterium]|nr:hypothetical protein [Burkholderiales bacterium]
MAAGAAGLCLGTPPARAEDTLVVIANSALKLDAEALKRVYTGRLVELDNLALRPVNLAPGHALRRRFLAAVMQQSEEDYLAYWTVRRYIGKGVPPRDLASPADVVDFVQRTPGAIGYIDASDLKPGVHVLLRR